MSLIKTHAVVIKEVTVGEFDKIITLFSKDLGKISAYVKGAKKGKSNLSASTQVFCYGIYNIYSSKSGYSVNSCEIINSFYNIRNSLEDLTYATYITEIISDIARENQSIPDVLKLYLVTLKQFAKKRLDNKLIKAIFELKLCVLLGYTPIVNKCAICNDTECEILFFSYEYCGFICEQCVEQDNQAKLLKFGTIKAIIYVVCSNSKELFAFNLSEDILKEFSEITEKYLYERMDKKFKSLEFLNELL